MESKQQTNASKATNFFVGIDGSDEAHKAFLMVQQFVQIDDKVTVGHVSNDEKTYLPLEQKTDHIKGKYESLLSGMGKHSLVLVEHLNQGKTTKEQVQDMATKVQSDVIFVGMHGRKGPKS